jgi:hypothetical protein
MSRINKSGFIAILGIASLACGLISNPLSGAQNFASTAEAIASAIPSGVPDVGQYLNPSGTPVETWNEIPIMPQATTGQEFNKNTYSFKTSGLTEADVEAFYKTKLISLGWTSQYGAQGGSQGGIMLFSKGSNILSITITQTDQDTVVLLITQ